MKYSYYSTTKHPWSFGSYMDDCGICDGRAELDGSIAYAIQSPDHIYFAWERLDRYGEPVGPLQVEKDVDMSRKDFIAGYMAGKKAMRKRVASDNYDQYQDKLLNITPEQVERAEFVDEYDRMLDDGFEPDEIIYSYGDNLTAEVGNWELTVEKTLGGYYKWSVTYWCDEVASGTAYSESDAVTLAVGSLHNAVVDAHSRSASRKAGKKLKGRVRKLDADLVTA